VLLLNVTYEPLTTVGLRRAVCLVLGGKAEVVHDEPAFAVRVLTLKRQGAGVEVVSYTKSVSPPKPLVADASRSAASTEQASDV